MWRHLFVFALSGRFDCVSTTLTRDIDCDCVVFCPAAAVTRHLRHGADTQTAQITQDWVLNLFWRLSIFLS